MDLLVSKRILIAGGAGFLGTRSHPAVRQWLAVHPHFHLQFIPTSASWLNLVERWFGVLSHQAILRGSFDRVALLSPSWNTGTRTPSPWSGPRALAESDAPSVRRRE
jgi:hypothetical protein